MTGQTWTWARLDPARLALVEETERAIGADFVVVYAPGDPRRDMPASLPLAPAALSDEQVEQLQRLEAEVGGVAVAYKKPD
ncbi:MAG TPA: hypothetical protein VIR16_03435 [Candidatus Limnocylindrales bacterium]